MHILLLLPLAYLVWPYLPSIHANPVQEVQLYSGRISLWLLGISLACSPAYYWLHTKWLITLRRLAGLYAFGYAFLHLLNFIWLDYGFNISFIQADFLLKRYAIAGIAAFLLILPLAITSNAGLRQRLGKDWKRLHLLVYPAAILAMVHYIWQAKIYIGLPVIAGIVLLALLALRWPLYLRRNK
ncbi:sulfite oxidase heme-binding subunit YedZ [Chloroflexota bacterium]